MKFDWIGQMCREKVLKMKDFLGKTHLDRKPKIEVFVDGVGQTIVFDRLTDNVGIYVGGKIRWFRDE